MSHIDEVKTKLRHLDDLETAALALGGVLVRDQKTHRTYGRFVGDSAEGRAFVESRGEAAIGKCEHAIRLVNAGGTDYEVGLVQSLDGDGWNMVYDSWGPGRRLEAAFGQGLKRLQQEYAAVVAARRAREKLAVKGFRVLPREVMANGRIRLRLRRG